MEIPKIIIQSEDWLAIDKPSGMVVHRSRGANDRYTLVATMREHLGPNVFPINRLDRGTSGVILMARSKEAARELSMAFAERTVQKTYEAVVRGWPPLGQGDEYSLERPMSGRPSSSRIQLICKTLLDEQLGRHPRTRLARMRIFPKTGIYHQIRRHLRGWGFPVVNDRKHGDRELNDKFHERFKIKRLLLHSQSLTFPFKGEEFTASTDWSGRTRGLLHHIGLLPEAENWRVKDSEENSK